MRLGILGAGQLGRMLALAGYPLAHEFTFYDISGNPSAGLGQIISDPQRHRLDEFLAGVDRVTYEFEHLPLDLAEAVASRVPLHPGIESLRLSQNRELEKGLFTRLGIPTPAYRVVDSAQSLAEAAEELGCPVVAKSVTEGYDGKGQAVLRSPGEAKDAWHAIGHPRLIVEAFVDFERELSIIAVRDAGGDVRFYPLTENRHQDGILRYSLAPAPGLKPSTREQAEGIMKLLLDELDHVGVLTLELFETENGLLANEIAPRVHNSGHWTIEGAVTSQFENHIRALSGQPLGDTGARCISCMINILGEHGDLEAILRLPYSHLHLYGKEERPGRKLGHINLLADSYEELHWRVQTCSQFVSGAPEFAIADREP